MQGSQASSTPGMVGTFSHAAPEMILGYKVNEKVRIPLCRSPATLAPSGSVESCMAWVEETSLLL